MGKKNQENLFDDSVGTLWGEEWSEMPEYISEDITPHSTINVQFESQEDREAFLKLLGENSARLKSIWFPKKEYLKQSKITSKPYAVAQNKYPIYVISKGRFENPLTHKALKKLCLDHKVVIEQQEFESYASEVDPDCLLVLPFSNLGQGSIPARNWVLDHARETGAERHWILDDNLDGFYRYNNNLKTKVIEENPFTSIEDFSDRYSNVVISGMQYEFFVTRRSKHPPVLINTRVYSCILISNSIKHRWRGRYNEDTDLCLRVLKDGDCTILFNTFLCKKMPTMTMDGGNSDELYQDDGRMQMAQSLVDQHPDVTKVTEKWGRFQHHVNYGPFRKNKLRKKT